jgi:nitroreductase
MLPSTRGEDATLDTLEAIAARRSIRTFRPDPVPRELIGKLLEATCLAPSGKNRQPWRFVVVQGEKRSEMLTVMRGGIEKAREAGVPLGSSEGTAAAMEQAPVTVFVLNGESVNYEEDDWGTVDVQSIGGAVQTMLLAATELGLGTLWICDVFYAYDELRAWLGREDQMVCAVSIGYANEDPGPRPRRPWHELTEWLG